MRYQDVVYGTINIPPEIWNLFGYPELVRLRGISQAVLPVEVNPFCTAANRFQHGIGVWHLAERVVRGPEFKHLAPDLPLAGLLHDAGNPPFSHTGDWFMVDATGYDGETHLGAMLGNSELTAALKRLGGDPVRIARLAAGADQPWSDLLAGTLDLDNIDNVRRYGWLQGLLRGWRDYDSYLLADAFRRSPEGDAVELDGSAEPEIMKWIAARRVIYGSVYSDPHLVMAMMLHRAVEIAYTGGELPMAFWSFTDAEALGHLRSCNGGTRRLITELEKFRPYGYVAEWDGHTYEQIEPDHWRNWRVRKAVADTLAEVSGMEEWETAAYLGRGKDHRHIALPLRSPEGVKPVDGCGLTEVYRIRLYLRRPPTPAVMLMLKDVPAFCRLAIAERLPALSPLARSPKDSATPPAGF